MDASVGRSDIRVSVIVPAYNAEDYIIAALRSALAQTESRLEVIVVDDASTDSTAAIVRQVAVEDPRVRLVCLEVNGGPAAARNLGISLARAEWVALLDADDRFASTRLATLLAMADREGADVVSDNLLLCEGGEHDARMIPESALAAPRLLSFVAFLEGCRYDSQTPTRVRYVFMHPVFRRSFLNDRGIRYDERSRNGEDFLFYVECFIRDARWWITPEPLYLYTVRAGSLTDTASAGDHARMVDRMRALLRDPRVARDTTLVAAVRRHWTLIASDHYYYEAKRALRERDIWRLWRVVSQNKVAGRLVLEQVLRRGTAMCRRSLVPLLAGSGKRA